MPAPFDQLTELLREQAVVANALPPEISGYRLKPETWVEGGDDMLAVRIAESLPPTVIGARIEGTPVLFCMLTGDPTYEGMRDNIRRLRNQATIARSWLDVDAPDLQMFVSFPPGEASTKEWVDYAGSIESDDRICRKLVWLPADGESGETAEDFLSRTFLASPWTAAIRSSTAVLDTMSEIELPMGWSDLVGDDSLDAATLVRRLAGLGDS